MKKIDIRATTLSDCEFIVKANEGKSEDFLHQWAGPSYDFPITKEQIKERLVDSIYTKFFTAQVQGKTIGTVELGFINYKKMECRICRFLIGEEYRNNGYGSQVSKYLIDYAFNNLKMERVLLNVSRSNSSAIKCYEKVGFKIVEKNGDRVHNKNNLLYEYSKI